MNFYPPTTDSIINKNAVGPNTSMENDQNVVKKAVKYRKYN